MSFEAYGHFAWVYDAPLGQPFAEATAPTIARIVGHYFGSKRGAALDLACGTGLSTRLLNDLGFDAIGFDGSLAMLEQARSRRVAVAAADIRSLPLRRRFPLVCCLYDSLNHMLTVDDLEAAIRQASLALDDGGILLFDVNQPEVYAALWDSDEPFTFRDDRRTMTMETSFDRSTGIATAVIKGSLRRDGKMFRFEEVRRQRAWTFEALSDALNGAGLRVDTRLDYDPFEQSADSGIGIKWLIAAVR